MSIGPPEKPCPLCGAMISVKAGRCPACRGRLDEDEDEDRPRRRDVRRRDDEELQPTDLIVPLNTSVWALLSCYMGLLGMCFPVVGLLLTVPALIFGIIALRQKGRGHAYGKATGSARAIFGIVFSVVNLLLSATLVIAIVMGR